MPQPSWFEVDKDGLSRLLEGRGKDRVITELVQNAWDEDGVTQVHVTLEEAEKPEKRGRSLLIVRDDAPDGFKDLTHAYTMFAPSKKVNDATKRGRFNLGEKLLLSICDSATIVSTTGGWDFTDQGRVEINNRRPYGSEITAIVKLTKPERLSAIEWLNMLLAPEGIATVVNGKILLPRTPVQTFEVSLPTEIANDEGILTRTRRKTTVRLFEPTGDEKPHIYEMGIPVVEHDGRWHVDIAQKVPLNMDRDNVRPSYLRELRVHVLNEAYGRVDDETTRNAWITDAISDSRIESEAVHRVVEGRYGDKAVIYDPSDRQANEEAVLQGYNVVHGGAFPKGAWDNIRNHGILLPAGQVTPSNSTVDTSEDGKDNVIPEEEWTAGMQQAADYAKRLAKDLLGESIYVTVHRSMQNFLAAYTPGHLMLNLQRLGHQWFNVLDQQKVDEIYLHEFAHHVVHNHLSEEFHNELCRLGALLRNSDVRI